MRVLSLGVVCVLLFGGIVSGQDDCVESRLEAGGFGQVTPGDANNVRDAPASSGELVGQIPGGAPFALTENDPVCAGSRLWVEVSYADFTGWTVEASGTDYWVEPLDGIVYEDDIIRLIYPVDYLTDIESETIPAQDQMGGTYPIRRQYALNIIMDEEVHPLVRYISIMPTADITEDAPIAFESLRRLRWFLINQPELVSPILEVYDPEDLPVEEQFLPLDPLYLGARRTFISSAHYVSAAEAEDVAFVTMYSQDILPVYNDGLFFNALLLTNDGDYMITVRLPIRTDEVIDDYRDFDFPVNWEDQYAGHIINTTNTLDALSPDDWQPSLDTLTAIAASIYVKGDIPEPDDE